jgi:hypothetical protein
MVSPATVEGVNKMQASWPKENLVGVLHVGRHLAHRNLVAARCRRCKAAIANED